MDTQLIVKEVDKDSVKPVSSSTSVSSKRLFIAAILGALSGMAPICTDLYLPALPQVSTSLGVSPSLSQLSLTTSLLGVALGQAFIGPISDMHGRRGILRFSLVIFVISSFLCAFAHSIETLIFLRLVQGLAGAGAVVLSRAMACDLYSGTDLTKFFALLMLINGLAPVLSPVLGGQILKFTDWRGIFIVLGICGIVLFMIAQWGLKETLPRERRNTAGALVAITLFRRLFSNRNFMRYGYTHAVVHVILFGYIAASPFILQGIYKLSVEQFSLCFAGCAICMIAASQVAGKLSGKYGEEAILRVGLVASLVSSVCLLGISLFTLPPLFLMLAMFVIPLVCFGLITTTSFSLAIRQLSGMAGSASGLIGVLSFLAGAIVSPLVGMGGGRTIIPLGIAFVLASTVALTQGWSRSVKPSAR